MKYILIVLLMCQVAVADEVYTNFGTSYGINHTKANSVDWTVGYEKEVTNRISFNFEGEYRSINNGFAGYTISPMVLATAYLNKSWPVSPYISAGGGVTYKDWNGSESKGDVALRGKVKAGVKGTWADRYTLFAQGSAIHDSNLYTDDNYGDDWFQVAWGFKVAF